MLGGAASGLIVRFVRTSHTRVVLNQNRSERDPVHTQSTLGKASSGSRSRDGELDLASVSRFSVRSLNERAASLFLALLLCGDVAFVAGHLINGLTPLLDNDPMGLDYRLLLKLDTDRGYSEIYQYLKFIWIAVLFLSLSLEKRTWHYLTWVLLFTYFLLDDILEIHEKLGFKLAQLFGFESALGLRPRDFGELMVSVLFGIFLLSLVIVAYRRGSMAFRMVSRDLALLVAGLVFFGVGIDMAHTALDFVPGLGVVEDGGEMLMTTLLLWYVILTKLRGESTDAYLSDFLRSVARRRRTTTN